MLAVPFRAPAPGAQWHAGLQAHVWVGRELPPELAPYDPPPYTFERFLEDELNEKPAAAAHGPADDARATSSATAPTWSPPTRPRAAGSSCSATTPASARPGRRSSR